MKRNLAKHSLIQSFGGALLHHSCKSISPRILALAEGWKNTGFSSFSSYTGQPPVDRYSYYSNNRNPLPPYSPYESTAMPTNASRPMDVLPNADAASSRSYPQRTIAYEERPPIQPGVYSSGGSANEQVLPPTPTYDYQAPYRTARTWYRGNGQRYVPSYQYANSGNQNTTGRFIPYARPYQEPAPYRPDHSADVSMSRNVNVNSLAFFGPQAMVMIEPKPALFVREGTTNTATQRYSVKRKGYLEFVFLKRLLNTRKYDRATRRKVRLDPEDLGCFLLPVSHLLANTTASSIVMGSTVSSSFETEEVHNLLPTNASGLHRRERESELASFLPYEENFLSFDETWGMTMRVGHESAPDNVILGLTICSPLTPSIEPASPLLTQRLRVGGTAEQLRAIQSEGTTYTVALKLKEYAMLKTLLKSTLSALLGWNALTYPFLPPLASKY